MERIIKSCKNGTLQSKKNLPCGSLEKNHEIVCRGDEKVDFNKDLSLSTSGIEGMLKEYEADVHTGMDVKKMAVKILLKESNTLFADMLK